MKGTPPITRWDAPTEAHDQFRLWAHERAAQLNPADASALFDAEFHRLHEDLARTLVQHGHSDEALVSRRARSSRTWSIRRRPPHLKSSRVTFTRTAA